MWDVPSGMGWWIGFGGIWMIIFWAGLIALVVWGITKLSKREGSTQGRNPTDVIKERYARGEISREEFEQMKKDLS
ncbi:MAG: SHOCT domain-containing protein [Dehalococcoidales bacterium]|nr:MAG: SHOCT domain-containing protein [Dehalococcoidales bacterium]